ncbi:MAG TPA: hypothetical protein VMD08_13600 [Candidatus Baltobacteraceae bacterium]|nr:hypothetical protein [Candidatus Baltobacteraceae bacterium]
MRGALAVALLVAGGGSTSDYSVLGGSVGFTSPADWREVARTDRDSSSFIAFVVPRPPADPSAPAGNVMIDIALSYRRLDLKTYSDAKLAQVAEGPGSPVLVDSRYWPDSTRTVLWSSRLRGTPYALWDKLAVRDSIYIDIRTAIPLSYSDDSAWEVRYHSQLDTLISSVCVGTRPLFGAAPARCPDVRRVLPFSPEENTDGARFVWLIERHNGMPRPYVAASDFPSSSDFRQVEPDSARDGDVVWWPSLVGFFDAGGKSLVLLEGRQPLATFVQRLGPPRFYRRLVPK